MPRFEVGIQGGGDRVPLDVHEGRGWVRQEREDRGKRFERPTSSSASSEAHQVYGPKRIGGTRDVELLEDVGDDEISATFA